MQTVLKILFQFTLTTLNYRKFLLNPKESIKFNLIVTGAKTDVAVRSRITAGKVVKGKAVKQNSLSDLRTISLRDYVKVVGIYLLAIALIGLFISLLYVLNLVWSVLQKSIPPNITLTFELILLLGFAVFL